jgi:hypothetical protein
MAFPYILSIPDAEVYNLYTDRRGLSLGQKAQTSDGREFRWANAGATLLVPGTVVCGVAPVTLHVLQTPTTAGVIGATTLVMTIGATAISVDQYRDGVMAVELGTGFGFAYPLDRHTNYLASATTVAIPFKRGVTLQTAVPPTANSVSFIASQFSSMVIMPATTATTPASGVAISAIPASGTPPATPQFGWVQTKGLASVLMIGTVVIGQNVGTPSGTAGGVLPIADDLTQVIGYVAHVATTTNRGVVSLNLP